MTPPLVKSMAPEIEAIKLDAIKSGMTIAAKIAGAYNALAKKRIERERDKLNEVPK